MAQMGPNPGNSKPSIEVYETFYFNNVDWFEYSISSVSKVFRNLVKTLSVFRIQSMEKKTKNKRKFQNL